MEYLGGMTSRAIPKCRLAVLGLAVVAVLVCSGCSYLGLDAMRPEVNGSDSMIVFPEAFEDAASSLTDGSEGSSGTAVPTPPPINWGVDFGPTESTGSTTGTMPADTVASTDYSRYLIDEVYTPVAEILSKSEATGVYFRVFHYGYDPADSEYSDYVEVGGGCDQQVCKGSVSNLAGRAIQEFAYEWLKDTNDNAKRIATSKQTALDTISRAVGSNDDDWSARWETYANTNKLSKSYLAMWNSEDGGYADLQDYYDAIESDPLGTVPNMVLQVGTSKVNRGYVTLNQVDSMDTSFSYKMSLNSVRKLFTKQNQYEECNKESTVENFYKDGYSQVFGHVDGFNKTIVVIGTNGKQTLQECLGPEDYASISRVFGSILSCTDVSSIKSIEGFENAGVLEHGTRGILQ